MNEMINTRLYADSESSTLCWMTFNLEIVISKFYLDTCFQNSKGLGGIKKTIALEQNSQERESYKRTTITL